MTTTSWTHVITAFQTVEHYRQAHDRTSATMAAWVADGFRTQEEADTTIARSAADLATVEANTTNEVRVIISKHKSLIAAAKALEAAPTTYPSLHKFRIEVFRIEDVA